MSISKASIFLIFLICNSANAFDRLQITEVSGFSVPGTSEMAKMQGFIKCLSKENFYECARPAKTYFMGAIVERALIVLNTKDNFSSQRLSGKAQSSGVLSYHGILFEFSKSQKIKFDESLILDGWLLDSSSATYKYYKKNVSAYIAVHQLFVALLPLQIESVKSEIEKINQRRQKNN